MMTRTDRRRFPILFAVIATLAIAGAALGLLFSPVQAQEGSAPAKPRLCPPRRPTTPSPSPGTTPRTTASPAT